MPGDNPGTILASDFSRCLHSMSDAAWVAMLKSMSDETLAIFHLWLLAEGGENMHGRWWTNTAQSAMDEIRRREERPAMPDRDILDDEPDGGLSVAAFCVVAYIAFAASGFTVLFLWLIGALQ